MQNEYLFTAVFFKSGNSEDGVREEVESKLYYGRKVFTVETHQLKTDYHKDKELQENFLFYIPEDLLITMQLSIIQKIYET